jgi:hypothetical protein
MGCLVFGLGEMDRPKTRAPTRSAAKFGRRPVTNKAKYPKVRVNGAAESMKLNKFRSDAVRLNSTADTAAETTTGRTPPSTPKNFTLRVSLAWVSRIGLECDRHGVPSENVV